VDNSKEKVNTSEHQESSADGSNLFYKNYLKLMQIAEGIMTGRYDYLKLKAPGFMDLVLEKISDNRISLSHYYEQNGDLMSDPDMEIIIDPNYEKVRAAIFQQDNLGIYQSAYNGNQLMDKGLSKELDDFLQSWLENIIAQDYVPYKALYASEVLAEIGNVRFDETGRETMLNSIEDDEMEI